MKRVVVLGFILYACAGEPRLCVPGEQVACACPGGALGGGVQVCNTDAKSFGPCVSCPVCKPGESITCACPNPSDGMGLQACRGDASGFGPCTGCPSGAGGGAGGGGSGAGGGSIVCGAGCVDLQLQTCAPGKDNNRCGERGQFCRICPAIAFCFSTDAGGACTPITFCPAGCVGSDGGCLPGTSFEDCGNRNDFCRTCFFNSVCVATDAGGICVFDGGVIDAGLPGG